MRLAAESKVFGLTTPSPEIPRRLICESPIRKARKLTGLKTKRQIVDKALELLVRTETRKGILACY
jgi:hypothetical protein